MEWWQCHYHPLAIYEGSLDGRSPNRCFNNLGIQDFVARFMCPNDGLWQSSSPRCMPIGDQLATKKGQAYV